MASILVVEDDSDIRDALVELLEAEGHRVARASDGFDALAKAHRDHPDLIFLDLMMPGMDGWQFRVEQERDPGIADIPVVVVSASLRPWDIGATAYIQKPCASTDLLDAVAKYASRAAMT